MCSPTCLPALPALQVYKRVLDKPIAEKRLAGICQRENSFFRDTVRAFRYVLNRPCPAPFVSAWMSRPGSVRASWMGLRHGLPALPALIIAVAA